MGIRCQITFSKLNFTRFVNQNVKILGKILGKRLYPLRYLGEFVTQSHIWLQTRPLSDIVRSGIHTYIHAYINILLRLPSTGVFSHNVNYYTILVIEIYSKLFRMKHIIKKCPLKTINFVSVLNIFG